MDRIVVEDGYYSTVCGSCQPDAPTCHCKCRYDDDDKKKCCMMDKETGDCTKCGHNYIEHKNTGYYWHHYVKT